MHTDSASWTQVTAGMVRHLIVMRCCHALQCNRHLFEYGICSLYCSSTPKSLVWSMLAKQASGTKKSDITVYYQASKSLVTWQRAQVRLLFRYG